MARRKNTAECREVLRKVFENESAGAGGNSDGRAPGPGGRSLAGRTGGSRIAGSGASEVDPLLGKPQGADSESFDRHDSIRSSAPGVGLGDRQAGFSGSIERPAGDRFTSNVSDYVEEPVAAGAESLETERADAALSNQAAESEVDPMPGVVVSGRVEDPVPESEAGNGGGEPRGSAGKTPGEDEFSGSDPLGAPMVEDPAPPEGDDRMWARFRGWLLGDDSRGLFGKPVEVRASTLVLCGLSVAIVVGLLGLYFKIEPQEGRLAGRILDERASSMGGVPAAAPGPPVKETPGAAGGKGAVRSSANIPKRGLSGLARPLWSRNGGQRPAVRNVEAGAAAAATPAAVGFVTTPATRWLRVRDLMGKTECARLLDHLKRLQKELKERDGCKDSSVACKELKSRVKERHGEDLYAVDIGPFATWSFAQKASAELKEMTQRAPWVFRDLPGYFSESYPRKP